MPSFNIETPKSERGIHKIHSVLYEQGAERLQKDTSNFRKLYILIVYFIEYYFYFFYNYLYLSICFLQNG